MQNNVIWHAYPVDKPAKEAQFCDFLIAYPNPRFYSSKFANLNYNRGVEPYNYDIRTWFGDKFFKDESVRFWAAIPKVRTASAARKSA